MTDATFPPVDQCVEVMSLGLAATGDLERWMAKHHPGYESRTMAAIAFSEAGIGPWATAEQLRLPTLMAMWVIVLDDYLEQEITERKEVDELVDRCKAVVRTGQPDDGHPLLGSLSEWQQEASKLATYPALSALWEESVGRTLDGYRYNWIAGWARESGNMPPGFTMGVDEHMAHIGSSAIGQVHVPRWLTYGGDTLWDHMDVLLPALEDTHYVCRLANDLGTIARERSQPGHNNILMYEGVTEDWVRGELDSRLTAVRSRLAPLVAEENLDALGVLRLAEWCFEQYLGKQIKAEFLVHGVD
jgi:hypothetical protein